MNIVFSSFSVCCFVTREQKLIGINLILEYFGLVLESFKKFCSVDFHQYLMFAREMENSWTNPNWIVFPLQIVCHRLESLCLVSTTQPAKLSVRQKAENENERMKNLPHPLSIYWKCAARLPSLGWGMVLVTSCHGIPQEVPIVTA